MSLINLKHEAAAIAAAVDTLRRGELVVFPTDTVYGVAADPRLAGARERLIAAKGRDEGKPIAYLAASADSVEQFGAQMNPRERRLAQAFWPGPLTLILKMRTAPGSEEGFRVPDHAFVLGLLGAIQTPLLVTSANASGRPAATSVDSARDQLGVHVALYIDGGETGSGSASSVVRASGATLELLREEALSLAALQEALK